MSDLLCFLPDGTEVVIGLNHGIPQALYHELPGVSQSALVTIRDRSPAHLKYERAHPRPSTPAQLLGSAVHDAVLLPDVFATSWVRQIEGDGRTAAVKAAREAQAAEHPEAAILPAEDYDKALAMRDAIARHPKARRLLEGDAEQSALWRDAATGLLCRGRFDLLSTRTPMIVDLKTARDASYEGFTRAIYDRCYHIQAAHYVSGAAALGTGHDRFAVVAIENEPPHEVALFELGADALEHGRRELQPLLQVYAWCQENDDWYGYADTVQMIDLPPWAPGQIDARIGEAA